MPRKILIATTLAAVIGLGAAPSMANDVFINQFGFGNEQAAMIDHRRGGCRSRIADQSRPERLFATGMNSRFVTTVMTAPSMRMRITPKRNVRKPPRKPPRRLPKAETTW